MGINCIEFVLHERTKKKAAFVIGNGMNRNCEWGSKNRAAFVQKEQGDQKTGEQKAMLFLLIGGINKSTIKLCHICKWEGMNKLYWICKYIRGRKKLLLFGKG